MPIFLSAVSKYSLYALENNTQAIDLQKFCLGKNGTLPEPKTIEELDKLNSWYMLAANKTYAKWYPGYLCRDQVAYYSDGVTVYNLTKVDFFEAACDVFYYHKNSHSEAAYGMADFEVYAGQYVPCETPGVN